VQTRFLGLRGRPPRSDAASFGLQRAEIATTLSLERLLRASDPELLAECRDKFPDAARRSFWQACLGCAAPGPSAYRDHVRALDTYMISAPVDGGR